MAKEPAAEAAPDNDAPEVTPFNAVIVHRIVDEEGNIQCDVQPVGDVKITEVQTVLELGIQRFRSKAGLS